LLIDVTVLVTRTRCEASSWIVFGTRDRSVLVRTNSISFLFLSLLQESKIHVLSKNDALKFIANLMSEEEAVGEVASMATSKSRYSAPFGTVRKALTATTEVDREQDSETENDEENTSNEEESPEVVAPRKRSRRQSVE